MYYLTSCQQYCSWFLNSPCTLQFYAILLIFVKVQKLAKFVSFWRFGDEGFEKVFIFIFFTSKGMSLHESTNILNYPHTALLQCELSALRQNHKTFSAETESSPKIYQNISIFVRN